MWSLGVLLFVIVGGTFPFQVADSQDRLFQRVNMGDWETFWKVHERQSTFSPELKDLLEMMLTIDPDKRPTLRQVATSAFFKEERDEEEVVTLSIN